MPIPLIYLAGAALVGGLGFGTYSAGRQVGQSIRENMPLIVGSVAVYTIYKASKK